MRKILLLLLFLVLLTNGAARAQMPSGTIVGVVSDPTGKSISGANVRITKSDSGLNRDLRTSEDGSYSTPSLPPGDYRVITEASGFRLLESTVTVETGATTTLNLTLEIGEINEQVNVDVTFPMIQYEQHQVAGLVSRKLIEDLPLNGRSFLELAKLEPGVQLPTRSSTNRNFLPILGQPVGSNGRGTRVTVDGGSIMAVGLGGTVMVLSQEVVREFQVSTVNFDLTTGLTNGAAINVSTRSGSNDLHGTAFYFLRDHKISAYPALRREPANLDPFFQRRQYGFTVGGPIQRNRFFFFGNLERNEQRGVGATTIVAPDFVNLNRITANQFFNTQLSQRLDGQLSNTHTAFLRYSHDRINSTGGASNAYPSTWSTQPGWADQSIFGLTTVLNKTLVNDFRFSYLNVDLNVEGVTERECPGCIGIGAPSITVAQTGLTLGRSSTDETVSRRFHLNDYVTWQRSTHRLRFGVDWEYNRGGTITTNHEPATVTLFSPQRARQSGIPLPAVFRTLDDILQLPLQSVTVGIGDPRVPQENGSLVRSWNTLRLFLQDSWRFKPGLTVNYGLGWSIDRNLNYDLTKPALLIPILGADGLGPTKKNWKDFSPVLGMAWAPGKDGKTVIRGGAGYFYDFLFQIILDGERALLGPSGLGRQNISDNRVFNCLPGIPGVPLGAPLNFLNAPTQFTGANLMACLPAIRSELARNLVTTDGSIQAIQLSKQGTLNPEDFPSWTSLHLNLGVQREIAREFVLSADLVYRHFDHLGLGQLDLNHFNSVRGPVIPRCLNEVSATIPAPFVRLDR